MKLLMRMTFHYSLALGACIAVCVPAACASGGRNAPGSGARVVALEAVYGDIVRQIAGDAVSVTTILASPSADPHAYEPTTRDADAIADADLVIDNGLG